MEAKITKRIEELTQARDKFIAQANTEVAAMNAAIGELKKLLEPDEPVAEVAE